MNKILGFIKVMRPQQWTKNLFIFSAILFANKFLVKSLLAKNFIGFFIFCFLSGSVYILNDSVDAELDKLDPVKCKRPIASGRISKSGALVFAFILTIASLTGAWFLSTKFFWLSISYLILNVLYSFYLKKIVIIDVIVVAFGFLIRALAGAFIVNVAPSPWFLVTTFMLALLLATSKRRYEFLLFENYDVSKKKAVLSSYNEKLLDQLIILSATSSLLSYSIYTVSQYLVRKSDMGHKSLIYTIPLVLYGIFRYLFIVYKKGKGGSPEKILVNDPHILSTVVIYGITVALMFIYL